MRGRDRLRAECEVGNGAGDVDLRIAGEREFGVDHAHAARCAKPAAGDAEFDRFNHYLARAIVQLIFSLAPDTIVLGTIAVAAGEELCFAPLREKVDALLWRHQRGQCAIVPAALGDDLPYLAALCAVDA